MSIIDRIAARRRGRKSWSQPPFWSYPDDYPLPFLSTWGLKPDREAIENDYEGYIRGAYKASGVVYACIAARQLVFSEARFQWREFRNGRPGELFGTPELALLENPWPGGTTGELLARMEIVSSLAGSYYATVADDQGRLGRAATGSGRRIVEMRPDWVQLVIGSSSDDPYALDAKVVALEYRPAARGAGNPSRPVLLLPDEVCHYSPMPDPEARWRGMSWLTPVLREISSDKAATKHKLKFFENAATPNIAVGLPKELTPKQFEDFVDAMDAKHKGVDHAYKTLYTAGGADVTVIGADMKQMDFKATQGAGETRIAACARVHPVIVGLSEGLAGSALNAGNYGIARRSFADGTIRPLWRIAAASLQNLVTPPREGVSLWFDERDVAFLRDDQKDVADVQAKQAQSIRNLTDAGYTADTVVRAVLEENFALLEHSGLFSVQLQPPSTTTTPPAPSTED